MVESTLIVCEDLGSSLMYAIMCCLVYYYFVW